MSTKIARESVAESSTGEVDNFTPDATREATQALMTNLQEWEDLAQTQVQALQAVATDSVALLSVVKSPKAAMQDVKANAEKVIALTTRHLQEVAGLSMGQFKAGVDMIQKRHPAADAFSDVVKAMRVAASTMESATISIMNAGISAQVSNSR